MEKYIKMDINKQHQDILHNTLNEIEFFSRNMEVSFMYYSNKIVESITDNQNDDSTKIQISSIIAVSSFVFITFNNYLNNIRCVATDKIKLIGDINNDTKDLCEKIFNNTIMNPLEILKELYDENEYNDKNFISQKISMTRKYFRDIEHHIVSFDFPRNLPWQKNSGCNCH